MDDPTLNLARRAVACKGWRWRPGMLTHEGYLLTRKRGDLWTCAAQDGRGLGRILGLARLSLRGSFPDLSDPATLGCLLALVRKAWGDPTFYVVCAGVKIKDTDVFGWDFFGQFKGLSCRGLLYRSEAEALVAALEAANE